VALSFNCPFVSLCMIFVIVPSYGDRVAIYGIQV
jgi:hypothetical protein